MHGQSHRSLQGVVCGFLRITDSGGSTTK